MIRYLLVFLIVFNSFNHVIYASKSYQLNNIYEIKKRNQFERIANLNRYDEIYRAEKLLRKQEEEEMRKKENQHLPTKSSHKSFFDKILVSLMGGRRKRFAKEQN